MLAPIIHYLPLTTIRRQRVLPANGRVLVHAGQKVSPTDVIAETSLTPQHALLEVYRTLGLLPSQVDQYIQAKMGDRVNKGDVIAGPVGVLSRVVHAPQDGKIVAIGEGQVLMELDSPAYQLRAGLAGTVVDLVPERGAVIETTGVLVQGVWGNDQADKSLLSVLSHSPEDGLTAAQLDVSQRGAVVLSGVCPNEAALQAAIDLPLRGLILGSMPSRLIPLAFKAPFPIILIEGFGRMPMNQVAYTLLSTNEQREVIVNSLACDRASGLRPEVVIPLPTGSPIPPPPETETFAPGQTVLIRRGGNAGQAGTLVSVKSEKTLFPSGVRASAGVVNLENGEHVTIPLANLEVIA